ncbi:MAG: AIR synthase-related protein, partial [Dehalococcoidia bacterium]|nr:AIR synthase-related protein [Dehalococcoidia bacterium]
TPVLGGLGLLDDVTRHCQSSFPEEGLPVVLLGSGGWRTRSSALGGSEYLQVVHSRVKGRPDIDLGLEKRVQELCRRAIRAGCIASAHDCSEGGLAVALAECCIQGGVGFRGDGGLPQRWDTALFGESQSRIVVSLAPGQSTSLEALATELNVPIQRLGVTGGNRLRWSRRVDLTLEELTGAWKNGLDGEVKRKD